MSRKHYVYDGLDPYVELGDSTDDVDKILLRGGNGQILVQPIDENPLEPHFLYYYPDGSGSVSDVLNFYVGGSSLLGHYDYDAYGNLIGSSGSDPDANYYRYSGKEYIPNVGMYNYGYRFYSPGMGRWINRDPIGESGGLNVYAFVGNNPTNYGDLDGLLGVKFGNGPNIGWGNPTLHFTGEDTVEGLKTGGAAVGSSFTFGLWNGGSYRCKTGFGTSRVLANIGRDSLLQAGGAGVLKSTKFMSWWSRGAGSGATGVGDSILYEIGQVTLKDQAYAQVAHIADPVARGREILRLGLLKYIDVGKAFSTGGTLGTGPSPGVRLLSKSIYVGGPIAYELHKGGDCGCQ